MNAFLSFINVLIVLGAILAIVLITGEDPGHLTLAWQGWQAETTAAVAAITAIIVAVLAFYLGQFFSWLVRLPSHISSWFRPAPPKAELATLLRAMALYEAGDTRTATRLLEKVNPRPEEEALEGFARLHLGLADPAETERWSDHPALGPLAALAKAQSAATQSNWLLVKNTCDAALTRFGKLANLQLLLLKAQLNLNESATNTLRDLKSTIPQHAWQLLDAAVRGPNTLTAAQLDNPWFSQFQHWLTTAEAPLPYAPQTTR